MKVALIPARCGSSRIPHKNLVIIDGHPMIAYAISEAIKSGEFDAVIVSTDCNEVAKVAIKYGAEVPSLRPRELAQGTSPDLDWISYTLTQVLQISKEDIIAILRPTNPLRSHNSISRAFNHLSNFSIWDSLRAVREVREHPRKMWKLIGNYMEPILQNQEYLEGIEAHSSPFQVLDKVFVQNGSLEIIRVSTILDKKSLTGDFVIPFELQGFEGFDVNYPDDLDVLSRLLELGKARLPEIEV